ncbi:hypothetical protein [uncultured Clostridium sp.]|uniref:hypothetical protein n=1 Tax=uncultured Clostridium sp. TaxID=59620 RepID=UPI0028ED1702|nr:hypothetical protein [uncultured Clostridium sp.]
MGEALSKNISKCEFKYNGRKFIVLQKQQAANIKGARCDIQDTSSIVININLSNRTKQLLIHKLVTGRRLRNFHNKSKVKMLII